MGLFGLLGKATAKVASHVVANKAVLPAAAAAATQIKDASETKKENKKEKLNKKYKAFVASAENDKSKVFLMRDENGLLAVHGKSGKLYTAEWIKGKIHLYDTFNKELFVIKQSVGLSRKGRIGYINKFNIPKYGTMREKRRLFYYGINTFLTLPHGYDIEIQKGPIHGAIIKYKRNVIGKFKDGILSILDESRYFECVLIVSILASARLPKGVYYLLSM